jgi:hypothetical protein
MKLRIEQRNIPTERYIGKNWLCPCGSGSKFKHCCKNKVAPKTLVPGMVKRNPVKLPSEDSLPA